MTNLSQSWLLGIAAVCAFTSIAVGDDSVPPRNAVEKANQDAANPRSATYENKAKNTKAALEDFFAFFDDRIDEIKKQPTTVKQDEALRALSKRLDDKLRTQNWELHCRITDIKDAGHNRYKISHDAPEEVGDSRDWHCCKEAPAMLLARQEAMALKPGDWITYSGVPRVLVDVELPGIAFFQRPVLHHTAVHTHVVQLTSVKIKLQKAADRKETAEGKEE